MKIKRHIPSETEPLCKFGPGGDYTTIWNPESIETHEVSSTLLRLLLSSFEALAITLHLKSVINSKNYKTDVSTHNQREECDNAAQNEKIKHSANSTTAPASQVDRRIPSGPLLFPDLGGDGLATGHKPKHRIRTHRRTTKKRFTIGQFEQGSLFKTHLKGTRIA